MARLKDPKLIRMRALETKERAGKLTDLENTELMQLEVWWGAHGARVHCPPLPTCSPYLDKLRWLDRHEALAVYVADLRSWLRKYGRSQDAEESSQACRQELERLRTFHADIPWNRIPLSMPPVDATDEEMRRAIAKQPTSESAKACRIRLYEDDAFKSWRIEADKYAMRVSCPDEQPESPDEGNAIAWENRLAALKATRRYWARVGQPEPAWLSDALAEARTRAERRGYLTTEAAMTAGAIQPRGRVRRKIKAKAEIDRLIRGWSANGHVLIDEDGLPFEPFEIRAEDADLWDDEKYLNLWIVRYLNARKVVDLWMPWDPPPQILSSNRRLWQLQPMYERAVERRAELAAARNVTTQSPVRPVELVEWKPTRAVDRNRAATDAATRQRMLLHVAQWESPAFESDGRKYIPERFLPRGIGGRAHDRIRGELAKKEMLQKRIVGLEQLAGPWWGFLQKDLDLAVMVDQDEA